MINGCWVGSGVVLPEFRDRCYNQAYLSSVIQHADHRPHVRRQLGCSGWLEAPAHVTWVGGWRKQACEYGRGLPHGGCTHVCIHTVGEWPAAPLWRRPAEEQKALFSRAELSVTNSSLGGDERWTCCHRPIKTDDYSLYLIRLYVESPPPLFQTHSLQIWLTKMSCFFISYLICCAGEYALIKEY